MQHHAAPFPDILFQHPDSISISSTGSIMLVDIPAASILSVCNTASTHPLPSRLSAPLFYRLYPGASAGGSPSSQWRVW